MVFMLKKDRLRARPVNEVWFVTGTRAADGDDSVAAVAVVLTPKLLQRLQYMVRWVREMGIICQASVGSQVMAVELSASLFTFTDYIRPVGPVTSHIVCSPEYMKEVLQSTTDVVELDLEHALESSLCSSRLLEHARFRITDRCVRLEATVFKSDPEVEVLCTGEISEDQLHSWLQLTKKGPR